MRALSSASFIFEIFSGFYESKTALPITGRAVSSKLIPKGILLRVFGFLFLRRNKPDRCSSDCKNYAAKQSKEQSRVRPEANEKVR